MNSPQRQVGIDTGQTLKRVCGGGHRFSGMLMHLPVQRANDPVRLAAIDPSTVLHGCVATFLLSSENHPQNVPLPNPKMLCAATFQPAIQAGMFFHDSVHARIKATSKMHMYE